MSERGKRPGDLLKNGYKIIDISYHAVLGFCDIKQQYATWQLDYAGDIANGHYFASSYMLTGQIDQKELSEVRDRAIGDYLLRK